VGDEGGEWGAQTEGCLQRMLLICAQTLEYKNILLRPEPQTGLNPTDS